MTEDAARTARTIAEFNMDAIARNQIPYENTGNPLFAWQALKSWFVLNGFLSRVNEQPLPMPDWVAGYLNIVATRMVDLTNRLDYRVTPEPFGKLPRTSKSLDLARARKPTLKTADERTKHIPAAFGLTKAGWNAFERFDTLMEQQVDAMSLELYTFDKANGDGEAIRMLLDDHEETARKNGTVVKVTDERSVRRRISKARRAWRTKP